MKNTKEKVENTQNTHQSPICGFGYKNNIKIQLFLLLPQGYKMASLCRMTHLLFHLWQAVLEIWLWVGSQEAVPVGRWSISLPESGQSQQHLQWVGHKHCSITATALRRCAMTWAVIHVTRVRAMQYQVSTKSLQWFGIITKSVWTG